MALGTIVLEAARAAMANATVEEVVRAALQARNNVDFYFTPSSLEFLRKGGRIGTASALIGSVLNINPILTVDMSKGMTHLHARARGSDGAMSIIYDILANDNEQYGLNTIHVHHISAEDRANEIMELLKGKYPDIPISVCSIGPVIGLHVGPGTVGVVYSTEKAKHVLI